MITKLAMSPLCATIIVYRGAIYTRHGGSVAHRNMFVAVRGLLTTQFLRQAPVGLWWAHLWCISKVNVGLAGSGLETESRNQGDGGAGLVLGG